MRQYRVYAMGTADRIALAQNVECQDDLAALEWAEKAAQREGLEIWDGERLVARVKAGNAALTA